jgi:hypothetical protein
VWSSVLGLELPETPDQQVEREIRTRKYNEQLAALKAQRSGATQRREALETLLKIPPVTEEGKANQAALEKELAGLKDQLKNLASRIEHQEFFKPVPPRAFGVRESPHPADMRITIRGNPRALGDLAPRGFVQVVARGVAPSIPSEQSGRLQLAEWLTSMENPLPARVLVNRVWQKLFGEGLVRSVDYFGLRGEPPSHPELLDHLARRFVSDGWSQKRLIRQLVLSRAYRMSGVAEQGAVQLDPDNRLLSRMPRVRLDAESLRDSILAVSGDLISCRGGPSLPLEFAQNVANLSPKSVNPPSFTLREFRPEQPYVRTVYLPVVRSSPQQGPADILNYFDFAQPAQFVGQRQTTSVPTQALFLLNSPLLKQQSQKLAAAILAAPANDDRERLAKLWRRALNRPMTDAESNDAVAFLASNELEAGANDKSPFNAWSRLCHALLISNEFLFRH